ncbi:MAG TPA: carbohydrate ABC transporter permease [Streptosporangiales bacterium]
MSTESEVATGTRVRGRRAERAESAVAARKTPFRPLRVVLHVFLGLVALAFLFPLLYAVYTAFRPYSDTARHGYVSLPHTLTVKNFTNAWTTGDIFGHFVATIIVVAPSLVLILLLSSSVAFGLSRYRIPGRRVLLVVFTAGNLLPQQILLTPLYQLYRVIDDSDFMYNHGWYVYDSYWGVIAIHVAFQVGFCTFVLANYMQALPEELTESALVDGAGAWRQFWQVTLPLCRPPLAALATLEFTWIYNDFLWALVLMSSGDKRPITSALNNLRGEFFVDNNLLAAGSLIIALPTMVVYFLLQRHFIRGLTLGATKG